MGNYAGTGGGQPACGPWPAPRSSRYLTSTDHRARVRVRIRLLVEAERGRARGWGMCAVPSEGEDIVCARWPMDWAACNFCHCRLSCASAREHTDSSLLVSPRDFPLRRDTGAPGARDPCGPACVLLLCHADPQFVTCCLSGESTAAFKVLRPDWVSATVTHQDLVAQHAPRPVHSLTFDYVLKLLKMLIHRSSTPSPTFWGSSRPRPKPGVWFTSSRTMPQRIRPKLRKSSCVVMAFRLSSGPPGLQISILSSTAGTG